MTANELTLQIGNFERITSIGVSTIVLNPVDYDSIERDILTQQTYNLTKPIRFRGCEVIRSSDIEKGNFRILTNLKNIKNH